MVCGIVGRMEGNAAVEGGLGGLTGGGLRCTREQEVCKLSNTPIDTAWVEAQDRKAQVIMEKLEMELNGYKTNLIKESIRVRPPPPT